MNLMEKKFTGRYLSSIEKDDPICKNKYKNLPVIDANTAYTFYHSYKLKKTRFKPDINKIKKCDDIIGICIEKNLFKDI